MTQGGYEVRSQSLRVQAAAVDGQTYRVTRARDALRKAFDRDRGALGGDQYGAELEQKMPEIEDKIFDLFKDYIDELDGIADGLRTNAGNYEQAEGP